MQCWILTLLEVTLLVCLNDDFADLARVVGQDQQSGILGKNLLGSQHYISNPANQSAPVLRVIQNNGEVTYFFCLDEQKRLKEFIHCTEASWKDHKGLGVFDEHRFAHEKVAKVQRDVEVWIGALLKRKFNIATDRDISTSLCAFVASFHDARAAASYYGKTCLCQQTRCLYRCDIGGILGFCTRGTKDRSEEH